jgi:predicted phage terminase large subunit-like protein
VGAVEAPQLRVSYTTFSASRARRIARKVRDLLDKLGVQLTSRLITALETPEGGCLLSCGIRGPLNGEGIDLAVIDDPYKNRIEAESSATNEGAWEWVEDVWLNRGHSKTSYLVFATRWTPNDLSGRLLRLNDGWEWLSFPALSEDGKSLWPERWTSEQLEAKRAKMSPLSWESLWMQNPRPRGNALFTASPGTYVELPKLYDAAFGVDLGYTSTSGDSSAVVKLLQERGSGLLYVAHVARVNVSPRRFKRLCRKLHRSEPAAPWMWFAASSELGAADLLTDPPRSVPLVAKQANKQSGSKRIRAMPFADAWNAGRVLVPKKAPWLEDFLANVLDFTGAEGGCDDDVDAVVAAFDALGADTEAEVSPKGKRLPAGSLYASGM